MNPLLRQRLVGTLVLVALGVVFWPLIFVTPDQRHPISVQPMTDKPDIERSPIAAPETYEAAVAEASGSAKRDAPPMVAHMR